jgi:hypothetical protein
MALTVTAIEADLACNPYSTPGSTNTYAAIVVGTPDESYYITVARMTGYGFDCWRYTTHEVGWIYLTPYNGGSDGTGRIELTVAGDDIAWEIFVDGVSKASGTFTDLAAEQWDTAELWARWVGTTGDTARNLRTEVTANGVTSEWPWNNASELADWTAGDDALVLTGGYVTGPSSSTYGSAYKSTWPEVSPGTGHPSIIITHNKRAWDWRDACWFGLGGFVDGKRALEIDPGYRRFREEQLGLQYIQYAQHDPESEAEDELNYAKDANRLATEMGLCEGWQTTWLDPLNAAGNKDADDAYFAPSLHFWDVQHQRQSNLYGAVCVGTYHYAAGVPHDLYYTVFPRGKLCGLLYQGSARKRLTGLVWLYQCETAEGTYSRVGSYTPDAQGFWRTDALLEKGWYYGVSNQDLGATCAAISLSIAGVQVANREYSFVGIIKARVQAQGDIGMYVQPGTLVPGYAYPDSGGDLMHNRIIEGISVPGTAVLVDNSRTYAAARATSGGSVIYVIGAGAEDGLLYLFTSEDGGVSWDAQGAVG